MRNKIRNKKRRKKGKKRRYLSILTLIRRNMGVGEGTYGTYAYVPDVGLRTVSD